MNQATKVTMAATMTAGVNHAEMASAMRAMGALRPCASRTMRTICCSAVSAPTRVARNEKAPVVFIVAPYTADPAVLSTGIDSPVSIDSSTADAPAITSPSTGSRSPGRTITMSPRSTSRVGTSSSMPSLMMRAVRGCRPIKPLDGLRRAPPRAGLEQLAEQDEDDDDDSRFEVDRHRTGFMTCGRRADWSRRRRARSWRRANTETPRRCRRR